MPSTPIAIFLCFLLLIPLLGALFFGHRIGNWYVKSLNNSSRDMLSNYAADA